MISVVIPTYNRGYILKTTLQTYFSDLVSEIIVVDDGSTDNTENIVKSFKNVKYVRHKKRLGLPSARNTGIKYVSENSKYIFFGEDDVVLLKNCYKIMLDVLTNNSLDIVVSNVKYLSNDEDWRKYTEYTEVKLIKLLSPKTIQDLYKLKSIHLAKKEVYQDLKFDEKYILSSYREETDFYLRANKKYKVAMVENFLAFNLPRSICSKGGEWSYSPFVYEFSAIYNNLRFFIKNRSIIGLNFNEILIEQIKFIVERLRSLKAKVLK